AYWDEYELDKDDLEAETYCCKHCNTKYVKNASRLQTHLEKYISYQNIKTFKFTIVFTSEEQYTAINIATGIENIIYEIRENKIKLQASQPTLLMAYLELYKLKISISENTEISNDFKTMELTNLDQADELNKVTNNEENLDQNLKDVIYKLFPDNELITYDKNG
ncbi:15994_t:CDS:2, partial [Gigaspora margarita]